jgi:hypothetical protein
LLLTSVKFTADLELISWNKAFSLLLRSTCIEKEAYILSTVGDGRIKIEGPLLIAYARYGFDVGGIYWDAYATNLPKSVKILDFIQRIGDEHTWFIDLDTTGVTPSTVPDAVLESTTFQLGIDDSGSATRYKMAVATFLAHPVLKYRYTTGSQADDVDQDQPAYCRAMMDLDDRLHDATVIEVMEMPRADRPRVFDDLIARLVRAHRLRGTFAMPDTWRYYDYEVVRHLVKAWKEHVRVTKQ